MAGNDFSKVYPFATEAVASYVDLNNFEGKSVCTLGSSLDQAFNFMVAGASKVTVYDINPMVYKYYKLKRRIILGCDKKEQVYDRILNSISTEKNISFSSDLHSKKAVTKMNNYLQTDENFNKLKYILNDNVDINFIVGDMYNIYNGVKGEKFDFINFSNALSYLYLCINQKLLKMVEKDCIETVSRNMQLKKLSLLVPQVLDLLNDEGLDLLFYFYNFRKYDIINKNGKLKYDNVIAENRSGELKLYDIMIKLYNSDLNCLLNYDIFDSFDANNNKDACLYLSRR